MKKKIFILLFSFICSTLYAANVYFYTPNDDDVFHGRTYTYYADLETRASVGFSIRTVSSYYAVDYYGARVQYPDGHWGAWQNVTSTQNGGFGLSPGTYHIQARVHVIAELGAPRNFFMYSNILTFYVEELPPLYLHMSGPTSLNSMQSGTWDVYASAGKSPYTYKWSYYKDCDDEKSKDEKAPPCGTWFTLANTSTRVTRYDYSSFIIKCIVTDANNTTFTASKNVIVTEVLKKQGENDSGEKLDYEKFLEHDVLENAISNYPNPFNPTTTINFQVKETGNVNIIIYDVLGREVKQLVNETKQPGSYSVSFDGSRLSSGIYFYTMRTNNFTASKKMLLTK